MRITAAYVRRRERHVNEEEAAIQKNIFHVAIGDEFDCAGGASRIVGIEDDPILGKLAAFVDLPRPGCAVAEPVTIPIALLAAIVAAYDHVVKVRIGGTDRPEMAA